jgi:hypothetical protein
MAALRGAIEALDEEALTHLLEAYRALARRYDIQTVLIETGQRIAQTAERYLHMRLGSPERLTPWHVKLPCGTKREWVEEGLRQYLDRSLGAFCNDTLPDSETFQRRVR